MRKQGKRFRTANLEVRHVASLLLRPRVGVIVPRYSHTAVKRNRVKRRLRDIARTEMLPALERVEFVLRALPSAYQATFDELRAQCREVLGQLVGTAGH